MQDCMNTVSDFGNVREAVCVSIQKIMDACRDQDCMEDLAVYLTEDSQETLECAGSVKARSAELLYAEVQTEPMGYREGNTTIGSLRMRCSVRFARQPSTDWRYSING